MPSIAVIGASSDRSRFANKCVRAYQQRGWTVYPVSNKEAEIEGLPAYASINDVPSPQIDLVTLYVRPEIGLPLLDDIARKSVGEVLLNPGADGPEVIRRAKELGLNVVVACSILAVGADPGAL